jgi:hypothetical protein
VSLPSCGTGRQTLERDADASTLDRTGKAVLAVNGFAADGNMFVKKVKQRLEVSELFLTFHCPSFVNPLLQPSMKCALTISSYIVSQWYRHAHAKDMPLRAIARLIQTMLYAKRFFPYYVYNILGGIEEDGEFAVHLLHFGVTLHSHNVANSIDKMQALEPCIPLIQ